MNHLSACDAGVEGAQPREQLQDSSSHDFVPPAGAAPPGRMCHSQPCPLSRPWPDDSGRAENPSTPARRTETPDLGSPGKDRAVLVELDASGAGAGTAMGEGDGRHADVRPAKDQPGGSELPSSAEPGLQSREQADDHILAPARHHSNAAAAVAALAAPGTGDVGAAGSMGPSQMGGTLDNGYSLQLNLSLGSQDDRILPTEVEPRSTEATARQLLATEMQLTGGFFPETQVEAALPAGDIRMPLPAELAANPGTSAEHPAFCPETQILDCSTPPPAPLSASTSAAQLVAPPTQQKSDMAEAVPAQQAAATEVQLESGLAIAAGDNTPAEAPQVSGALACSAAAQDRQEHLPVPVSSEPAAAVATANGAIPVQPRLEVMAEQTYSPQMGAREQAQGQTLLKTPEPATGGACPARTPASRGPTMSLGLLSEDFISESEGTQRAVMAAKIIDE